MNTPAPTPRWPGRRTEAVALFFILVVAAAFRVYQLGQIPPGITHDEADHGHDAIAILHGARPIYETVGYGREPLYDYVAAWLMPIFGPHYTTLRLASVLAGLLLIVVAHFWIRRAFDVPTALVTSSLLAVAFWAIPSDRQALRSALLPTLFTIVIYFMWQALQPYKHHALPRPSPAAARWLAYALAGLFLGLSLYTYMAARALPGVFVLLWFYLLIFHRSLWKTNWSGLIGMVALGVIVTLPMFSYLAAHPGTEQRLTQLSGPIDRLFAGDPSELAGNVLGALGMFTVSGDNLWLYNIPGRPILDFFLGVMFYFGLVLTILRFRKIEYALILFWLLLGIFPSLLTGVVASSLRSIAAQPIVYLIVAIGGIEIVRGIDRVVDSHTLRSIPLVVLIIAITVSTYHDYFDLWGQAPDVRVAYHHTLFEVAQYLDRDPDAQPVVAISSIYPNRYHDPYAMELTLYRDDLSLRWFTGSFVDMTGEPHASLVFPQLPAAAVGCQVAQAVRCDSGAPQTAQTAPVFTSTLPMVAAGTGVTTTTAVTTSVAPVTVTLVVQSRVPIDPLLGGVFDRHAVLRDTVELRATDFISHFDVYDFDAAGALADALKSSTTPTGTLDFNHTLSLIGYTIATPQVKPGDTVAAVTKSRCSA